MTAYEKYEICRDAKGLNNYQVSKETGISQTTLSEWKSGQYRPKYEKLKVLADFFDVTVEDLIGD